MITPFLKFLGEAVLISLSGVMAPGPVTAITVGKGNESPHAGAFISFGHGIVEFPLMIALFFGFKMIINITFIQVAIGILGGLFLLFMGAGMLKDINAPDVKSKEDPHPPIITGMLLSIGNPYFLLWWATIGVSLITRSIGFGIFGFAVFAVVHWLCDFIWLYLLSLLSYKGKNFFGKKFQKIVFGFCGAALIIFGGIFIKDAALTILQNR
ncbi:LysE family transporter [Candidatus Sumerlaeota bacterium]|nr:LysE family transporter [Candidatus Sumerlaeota bacterium]